MKEVSIYRGGIIAKAYYKRAKSTVHKDIPFGVEQKGTGVSLHACFCTLGSKPCPGLDVACRRFCHGLTAEKGLHIFKWLKKISKEESRCMTRENDMKFSFPCPSIKFYWNQVTRVHLCLVCGCFWRQQR